MASCGVTTGASSNVTPSSCEPSLAVTSSPLVAASLVVAASLAAAAS